MYETNSFLHCIVLLRNSKSLSKSWKWIVESYVNIFREQVISVPKDVVLTATIVFLDFVKYIAVLASFSEETILTTFLVYFFYDQLGWG